MPDKNTLLVLGVEEHDPLSGGWWSAALKAAVALQFGWTVFGQMPNVDYQDEQVTVLAVGYGGLQAVLQQPPGLRGRPLIYYHIEPFAVWHPGMQPPATILAPTQALAEDIGQMMNQSVRVVSAGSAVHQGFHRYDLLRREPGPEELRPLLWPTAPQVDRLYGALIGRLSNTELAALFAAFSQLLDDPSWHLVLIDDSYAPRNLMEFLAASGLEDRTTVDTQRVPAQTLDILNALDVLVCPPWNGQNLAIELAMACGCVPAVVDDARWAERVDKSRGIELPSFPVPYGERLSTLIDPTGAAQVLRQVTRTELQTRRANCQAWATSAAAGPDAIGALWRQFLA